MPEHDYTLLEGLPYLSGSTGLFFSKVHLEPPSDICPFHIYIITFSEYRQF
ncbi:hypothetical protein LEP1GSC101_2934 [Leptospira borgpetersenii str. UI 09149]|nr:hypothetical protein LEP1GSC101_2934 [Leptospira borgpetersenii str. UI 09149]EMN56532.1 hypothetical protein LEP1GSC090_3606 [Leptospira borgpetersenii serovar Javanica str. MK146]